MERGALVDKMFYSIQLAFRRLPASLAVATLIVCTFWGIASGLVGAVVVLMGVIAMGPMLKAGYDAKLASGVITAGGTLGILIPPSVMIIVYAAVAGQSVVKLYASAMFPGFFLALLYLIYIIGWAIINPKIAPRLEVKVPVPAWITELQAAYRNNMLVSLLVAAVNPSRASHIVVDGKPLGYLGVLRNLLAALFPLIMTVVTLWAVYWYVVIHPMADVAATKPVPMATAPAAAAESASTGLTTPPTESGASTGLTTPPAEDQVQELGAAATVEGTVSKDTGMPLEVGSAELRAQAGTAPAELGPPPEFFYWFWGIVALTALVLLWYYAKLGAAQFELLKLLTTSVMPLAILTFVVLAVILFGITTATESAAIGAAGAFLMGFQARTLNWERVKQSVFLTAKTTAMVCWLFVGSALFSAVFALLGGQALVERWVLSFNLTPVQFMILSQAIIFLLGWPLEWTEIIIIFVPIFLPMLKHFNIDPVLWGCLVFVNLQAAFLSPPVAMSAFYLKGVAPKHVTLNQIFSGMMPYMLIVILCMVIMYLWPGMTLWLPNYLYGG
jgi:TRAP-type mannitol/chloroaromatic compound transport system permease large subunit